MAKKVRNETTVGMFVVIGFLLLTVVIFFISGVYFFKSGYSLNVIYDYVSILDRGAPVRMAGVKVGEVSQVNLFFDEKSGGTKVKVKLFIEKGVEIRENYNLYIRGTHILSEPHIEISPMPGSSPVIAPGTTLIGEQPIPVEVLVQKGHSIAHNLDEIVRGLRAALEDEVTAKSLKEIVLNLASVTEALEKVMVDSEGELGASIQNLGASMKSLNNVLDKMERGEGTVGKLLVEDELYNEIREFVGEIKKHPWKLLKKEDDKKGFLFF